MNPNDQYQVQPLPEQNLSSEEDFSQDYELFSKKNKDNKIYIIIGVVSTILILILASLVYFGVIKF